MGDSNEALPQPCPRVAIGDAAGSSTRSGDWGGGTINLGGPGGKRGDLGGVIPPRVHEGAADSVTLLVIEPLPAPLSCEGRVIVAACFKRSRKEGGGCSRKVIGRSTLAELCDFASRGVQLDAEVGPVLVRCTAAAIVRRSLPDPTRTCRAENGGILGVPVGEAC